MNGGNMALKETSAEELLDFIKNKNESSDLTNKQIEHIEDNQNFDDEEYHQWEDHQSYYTYDNTREFDTEDEEIENTEIVDEPYNQTREYKATVRDLIEFLRDEIRILDREESDCSKSSERLAIAEEILLRELNESDKIKREFTIRLEGANPRIVVLKNEPVNDRE